MKKSVLLSSVGGCLLLALPAAYATTVANPICPANTAFFDPGNGENIVVPPGYSVSVFKAGLNFPTGIAFRETGQYGKFEVYVLKSGHGLPSTPCNEQDSFGSGQFDPTNPFTPDILVFDESGKLIRGPLAKPTANGDGLQAAGPAVDIAFEQGLKGGRLFASDSNQATHAAGQNNSSRIVVVDPDSGHVTPFITNLPTGDHPTEQLAFRDGWIYWSQGSTTNSGVVGRDNGGGTNQQDIPCQDITLSNNVFNSGGSPDVKTSGYSPFGTTQPGATVKAFTSAMHHGVCDGAILRARLDSDTPDQTIEPYSWGYRNGYAIRFAPRNHVLQGQMLVGEDGQTSAVPGRRIMRLTTYSWLCPTRTAAPTITVGPTGSASSRPARPCSTRRAARAMISVCPIRRTHPACAQRRASLSSWSRMSQSRTCWRSRHSQ